MVFLKLYRSAVAAIDTTRPDLFVHRLIDRLGLRRQQLFAAQADVVERLRALARFGELASAYARRSPQATPREFARSIAAVADSGLREQDEPELIEPGAVQIVSLEAGCAARGGARVRGRAARRARRAASGADPRRACCPARSRRHGACAACWLRAGAVRWRSPGPAGGRCSATRASTTGARRCRPRRCAEAPRGAVGGAWEDKQEELFGPAETLHSTYRMLRDELLEGTMRAGGRLGELRFDTDLDVSHAVVRYLELLKLAALIARPEGQSSPRRCATSTPGSSRRSPPSSGRSSAPRRSTTICSTRSATSGGARRRSPRATSPRSSRSCPSAATGWCSRPRTSTRTGHAR